MVRREVLIAAGLAGFVSAPLAAEPGPWVTFVNETATRLVASPGLGSSDPEEKDYAWGDLDQDGDDDLVVARKQPYSTPGRKPNVLFMNEGGVLTDRTLELASDSDVPGDQGFLTPTADRDIVVVDVNNDTWLDVVTAPTYGFDQPFHISHPRVYINKGDDAQGNWLGLKYESFRFPPYAAGHPNFCAVAAGDVTGDGAPELYFVDYDRFTPTSPFDDRLMINSGSGIFADQSDLRMTPDILDSGFGHSGAIADMNGDEKADVVKGTALGPTRISVAYTNPLTPGFYPQSLFQSSAATGSTYFVSVGELNNDGRMDLIVTDDGTDHYHLNQGSGPTGMVNWGSASLPNSGGFGSNSIVADLNDDGWNDVIVADVDVDISGCSRQTHIYQNNANPPNVSFTENLGGIPTSMLTGGHDVAVMNINGDEWPDLVIGRCSGTQVWINVPPDLPGPEADLNGDDVVDGLDLGILLANWSIPAGSPGCGGASPCEADLNDDGVVDGLDLGMLLAQWTL